MAESANELITQLLTGTVKLLDVPPAMQAAAEQIYDEVGLWLGDHLDSDAHWHVYPQGSGRLGTAVRPSENEDFDLDAVAECNVKKDDITKIELKGCLGDGLQSYVEEHKDDDKRPTECEEGRRCWTLVGDDLEFHIDFLPAIPDEDAPPTGILLPDRDLFKWQHSNPIAYADWFHERSYAEFVSLRTALAKSLQVSIDDIPAWQVKTTLQQAVQVMKLHRNHFFENNLDERPPSILVTTLAGHAYRGQKLLFDAVMDMVSLMPQYIDKEEGKYVVRNPVQPEENFADRWSNPARARKFFQWLESLERALEDAANTRTGLDDLVQRLGSNFGMSPVQKSAKLLGERRTAARPVGGLAVTATGALTAGPGTRVRDHVFHGD